MRVNWGFIRVHIQEKPQEMFGNSLAEEYRLLVLKHGFSREEIKALILGSIEMSWMPMEKKQQFKAAFFEHPAWDE